MEWCHEVIGSIYVVPSFPFTSFSSSSKPPELGQPNLSRSNGSHHQRESTILGVFVPILLVLPRCESTNLGVFDLCHFGLLKRGCANSGGFGAR